MKSFILSSLIVFSSATGFAQNTSQLGYFEKLSKALRGMPPSMDEREEFKKAETLNQTDTFTQKKVAEYLTSQTFQYRMKVRVDEYFRLKADSNPLNVNTNNIGPAKATAYDFLVAGIFEKNLSWDELLIGKTYIYAQKKSPLITVGMQVNDFFFFKNILESSVPYNLEDDAIAIPYLDQSKEQLPLETITFDKNDPRIAGVLTTSRFLNRYQNTALNKNRRRSAAVFRSFLCDDMVAAIPAKTNDSERTDYDVLLPTTAQPPSGSSKTEDQLRKELRKNDPHGSLQGCMNCHYKLDPMGKTFALSASGLSAESSPGALVYKSGERNINIPVKGIGELAANIIQQKEYVNCQVNLFWKWFIGQDVPKTSARQEELVQAFEKGGRRPLDFISYLVQSREFKAPPVFLSEEQLLARKAAKVLRRCYDCHKDQTDNPEIQAWDLTDLPYGNDPAGRNFSVHQIAWVLDIPHDGAKKKMPPKESLWQLSPDEFETMKQWITQGAPDYSGQRQVP